MHSYQNPDFNLYNSTILRSKSRRMIQILITVRSHDPTILIYSTIRPTYTSFYLHTSPILVTHLTFYTIQYVILII